ncbi:MAG: hypothetical protein K2X87_13355 [Gemmataceae bacterium]|nr:hypothetical protein [Gemmataceae bacterium]
MATARSRRRVDRELCDDVAAASAALAVNTLLPALRGLDAPDQFQRLKDFAEGIIHAYSDGLAEWGAVPLPGPSPN